MCNHSKGFHGEYIPFEAVAVEKVGQKVHAFKLYGYCYGEQLKGFNL